MVSRRIVLWLTGVCILHKSEGIDVEVGVVILVLLQERCNDQCRTTSLVICKHSRALYKTTYKQGAIQTYLESLYNQLGLQIWLLSG